MRHALTSLLLLDGLRTYQQPHSNLTPIPASHPERDHHHPQQLHASCAWVHTSTDGCRVLATHAFRHDAHYPRLSLTPSLHNAVAVTWILVLLYVYNL
jgi:hypothetical protein